MADLVQDTRIQFKRAYLSFWTSSNPILAEGEPGYIIDLQRYKVGDGVTPWNDLPYTENSGYNYIINSGFDIWQRSTSFVNPATGSRTADRWMVLHDNPTTSSAAYTVSAQQLDAEIMHDVTPGSEGGYEGSLFFRYDLVTGDLTDTRRAIRQSIEDVRTFSNQYVTVSFYAKADLDSDPTNNQNRDISFFLEQNFGTAGGSGPLATSPAKVSLTANWQRYSATFFVPSISGIYIGADSYINLFFYLPIDQYNTEIGYTIDLWGVMVEPSETMSKTFKRNSPTYGQELENCKRYYQTSGVHDFSPVTSTAANANFHSINLSPTMRSTPTISFPAGIREVSYSTGSQVTVATRTPVAMAQNKSLFAIRVLEAGATVGNAFTFIWNAESEL